MKLPLLRVNSSHSHWISEKPYKLQLKNVCLREESIYLSVFILLVKGGPRHQLAHTWELHVLHTDLVPVLWCQGTPTSD